MLGLGCHCAHFGQPGDETDLPYIAGLLALCVGGDARGPEDHDANADTSCVPNLSLLCQLSCIYRSEQPPIPARAVRRLRLNAIPLGRRMATLAERPFSGTPFHSARFRCGHAGTASQALVGHNALPPAPVLGYSPTATAGASTAAALDGRAQCCGLSLPTLTQRGWAP